MKRPELLIEQWLPIQELGIESQRENSTGKHPPLNRLHVWWARRPIVATGAAIIASLLPAWKKSWPKKLLQEFPTEETYRKWFLNLLGILDDPIAGRKLIDWAKEKDIKLKGSPYGYRRAFTLNPSEEKLNTLYDIIEHTWGTREMTLADPMAGGGSIPFEALRYGLTTFANELNSVSTVILKATLDYPVRFGPDLADDIRKYGDIWVKKVQATLEPYYYLEDRAESIFAYIWARTVACPITGKPVPLSPNWWLRKGKDPVAVKLIAEDNAEECRFEIVKGKTACAKAKPDEGTVKRGVGLSPWTNETIDGDYIKAEAQAGRMGQQLYVIAVKRKRGVSFRKPLKEDIQAVRKAERKLQDKSSEWETSGLIPCEPIPPGNKTSEPLRYGMRFWRDLFSPRQLLALGTFVKSLRDVQAQIRQEMENSRADAVSTYLAITLDKCCDYNSRMVRWHTGRAVVAGTFDRHDFSFKWSHAEFDASRNLLPWALDQVIDAYEGIVKLAEPARLPLFSSDGVSVVEKLKTSHGNAASLSDIPDGSIKVVCVDPPYKANVMYAECSDFFYVWMKRTLGETFPELFVEELTNKDEEAVANIARFASFKGKKKTELANRDYENKMAASFREMHRILAPEGVLTVMFTHKEVSAWDALASALIGAGFAIHASWPVHTESRHSLHQAKKNAAASTIFLVCRKREPNGESVWWEDLKGKVREIAREKAAEFEKQGIKGVDLYISTFGPALSIISEHWPVLTSETDDKGDPLPLRPEQALDLAREEVVALRKRGLLLGHVVQFDPLTDWYIMAWDAFQAEEFPADEARKLSIALGLSLEEQVIRQKRLVSKKANFVVLQNPTARRKKKMVDPELDVFDDWIDAVHTTMLVYQEDGSKACERFLKSSGLLIDGTFKACLQALINAIPRTKKKGKYIREEAETLENIRLAFFEDLEVPPEEAPPQLPPETRHFKAEGFGTEGEEDEEEEIEEEDED